VSHPHRLALPLVVCLAASFSACTRAPDSREAGSAKAVAARESARGQCPASLPKAPDIPGSPAVLENLDYWLARHSKADLDRPLLREPNVRSLDSALRIGADGAPRPVALAFPLPLPEIQRLYTAQLDFWRERFRTGEYGVAEGEAQALLEAQAREAFAPSVSMRVALEDLQLSCVPMTQKLLRLKGDLRFDRNACSRARAQEPVEVLGRLGGAWYFVRTRDALGFLPVAGKLTAEVSKAHAEALRAGRERTLVADVSSDGVTLPKGTHLAQAQDGTTFVARSGELPSATVGLSRSEAADALAPITRRRLLTEAFRYLHAPYGLGDEGGGRDCSRYVSDVLRDFGLHMPRLSGEQSSSGQYSVDVPPEASEADRFNLLDEAHESGVVLIHFPGHIMFYLGRDAGGVPRVIHAFAEFMKPCAGGGESLQVVESVRVSGLDLGRGSSRRSFLERMTRLTVLGEAPSAALQGLAQFRAAAPTPKHAPCEQGKDVALFADKHKPRPGEPLRMIAVSEKDMRPARVLVEGPDGRVLDADTKDLGVGPFARVASTTLQGAGLYTVRVADGENVLACTKLDVRPASQGRASEAPRAADAPAWTDRHAWAPKYEQLFAAFVEQLFSYPVEEQRSFSALHEVLRDPARNLLYDLNEPGEDARLPVSPDCADLPYFLRAYFAWKHSLPFGYRQCNRGRAGAAPRCGELADNRTPVEAADRVDAFARFLRTKVGNAVHSASGRTLPDDPSTDLYPLSLTRRALAPGSVFVDPYGHLIVVAKWLPEGVPGSGVLIGADAQPDHTVGRRRFWRGNFLFTPDLSDVGAGFKAFRPVERDTKTGELTQLDDAAIRKLSHERAPSRMQYDAPADAFYERMDQLIHPRPLSVEQRLTELVSALEEQVLRRVEAIDVGEAHMRKSGGVMAMPEAKAIFETTGPWEDFATPSRDMRLLIAIDAVLGLPEAVRTSPGRYAADAATVSALPGRLDAALRARTLSYTRSDGAKQALSLAEVVARAPAIELGFNPNDCVERRWGAPDGSAELASCKRAAPESQRVAMTKVRSWFATRTRPPRP